jgi:PAS domain S-box-containing protein
MNDPNKSKGEIENEIIELQAANKNYKKLIGDLEQKLLNTEKLLINQSKRFADINKFSIDLTNEPDENTPSFIVTEFKSIFKVMEVGISTFDESKSEMVVSATTLSEKVHAKIVRLLGTTILGNKTFISPQDYTNMVETAICEPSTLNEVSFGKIPVVISTLIEKLFKIGWFQAISLTDKGKLYGGLMIAGHKGQEKLQKDELITFTEITSNILRRKKMEKDLVASEKRYRQLSDLLPQIIFESDLQGNITFANQFSLKLLGLSQDDLESGINLFNIVAPENRSSVISRLKDIINGSETTPKEYYLIRKNGETFPIIMHAALIIENGSKKGLRGIGVDITERKQIEEEIRLKNEQLQKLNAEKDKFFSILAHDLRGPFTNFLGFTQLMTDGLNSMTYPEIEKIAESMRTSANNLYTLLENLLEWSEMQRGRIDFNPVKFNLLKEITACLELITSPARKKRITIDIGVPEKLEITADLQMFDTVIRNFVSNAIKFTPQGGSIVITASATNEGSVEIGIEDTGIGMSEELQDKLFKINEKTNREGTDGEPSTGLGLLLCKEFIEKHNGKIWVISQVDKGSTFIFTLPLLG